MNEAFVASHTSAFKIFLSKRSRCLILRQDKLKLFDEIEILFSANAYCSACHADEGSIYPSSA